jgi:hypothetical protein
MLLPSNTNYTDRDFETLRLRLASLVRSVFPTWTDVSVANFANHLLEAFAWVGDVLGFYQDQQARETRFGTVQLRQNMIALTRLIGYALPGATAAQTTVTITCTNAASLTGTIVTAAPSTPVVLQTDSATAPVRGEVRSPLPFALAASVGDGTFTWEHSLTAPRVTVAATGRASQRVLLPAVPFLGDGSCVVQTSLQGTFTRVDSFYLSTPADLHYRCLVDQNDQATVEFGDGLLGALPQGTITVDYRTGGGVAGNILPATLTRVVGSFVDSRGQPAYLIATNPLRATGGANREEVEAARVHAPASLRTLTRCVTADDFEQTARAVPGVARTLLLTSNELATIGENCGILYVVPVGGGTPAQALLDAVTTAVTVTKPHTVTFQLTVSPATYRTLDVRAVVFLTAGASAATVRTAIAAALAAWFAPSLDSGLANPTVDFGARYCTATGMPASEIAWSDLFNAVRDVAGVRKVGAGDTDFQINGTRADVPLALWEFPALGTVTLINGDTGAVL